MRFLLAIVLALFPAALYAADAPESFTLENGLEVIVIPNHRVPAISHMMWYRVGAGDDPQGKSGLAHYHEHTMFLGTEKHKAGEFSDIVARHGGEQNAFTGHDATSYYINIAKEELPLAMELEADRMHGLFPTDEAMAKEKQVIIEERRMRIENSPSALLGEQVNAALFRNHPYHLPVIGWLSEMEGLTKKDVIDFHNTWYHPNNAVLIVSGDITAAELKPLAEKYYGGLPSVPVPTRHWNEEPPQIAERFVIMHHKNVKQPQWLRVYATSSLAYGDKTQALPLFVSAQILGGGKLSRMYHALVVEQKIASDINVDYNGFSLGPAEYSVSVTPQPGVEFSTVQKAVDAQLAAFIKDGPTAEELARAKTLLKAETIYAREGLTGMAQIVGWQRMIGLPADYYTTWPTLVDAVTATAIQAATKDALQLKQSVTAQLLPEETAVPAAEEPAAKKPGAKK